VIGPVLVLLACRQEPAVAPASAPPSLADEVRGLIAQGDADAALARLQGTDKSDGEVLYLEGLAWARKAENAPAPEAGAGASASRDLKPEEEQALSFLERAVAIQPGLAAAHLALADVLGPHALRRETLGRAVASARFRGEATLPDSGVDRVLQAYRRAAQADGASKPAVDAWIDFASRAGRLDEADAAFQQLLARDKENADPFLRYGDFLVARKDEMGAINAYSRALIWQPNLESARAKIADIYLAQSEAHFARKEYASTEARLRDALRYAGPPESPQARRLRRLQAQLAQIRGR
jgi:hypothetical protein